MAELRIQPRSVGSTVHSLSHFNKLPVLEWSQIAFSGVEDALRNDLECRQIRCRQRCCLLPVLWQSKLEKATDGLSLEFQFSSVAHLCPAICNPMDCSPPGSSHNGDSPGKDNGICCHALFQGIFPTQGSNPGLQHCMQIFFFLPSEPPGKPKNSIDWLGDLGNICWMWTSAKALASYCLCGRKVFCCPAHLPRTVTW